MTRLCIFDLDGTLVDSLNDLADAMNHALTKQGFLPHPPEAYRQMVGSGVSVLADRAMKTASPDPAVKEQLLRDFADYYREHCLDHTRPYDGMAALLDTLSEQGVLFAVNSNKPDPFTNHIVHTLFPDAAFAAIVGKRDEFERKPAPDGVFEILRLTGIPKEACLFIGDSNVDVFTAQNAGVAFCGVSWGFRTPQELRAAGADTIVDTPHQLLNSIRN